MPFSRMVPGFMGIDGPCFAGAVRTCSSCCLRVGNLESTVRLLVGTAEEAVRPTADEGKAWDCAAGGEDGFVRPEARGRLCDDP